MNENIVRRHPDPNPSQPDSRILRCAFTGYRPQKMPFGFNEQDPLCEDFKQRLHDTLEMLVHQGYSHFLSGGALGMDMLAAEMIIGLREQYPHIALQIAIPFDEQSAKWKPEYRERYMRMLDEADIITYTGHQYTKSCMFARNRYLVNNADLLLAAYDGLPGGTAMTVRYAREMDIQVICIPLITEKMKKMLTA